MDADDDEAAVTACVALGMLEDEPKHQRRTHCFHVRPMFRERRKRGFSYALVPEMVLADHERFFQFFRMSPSTFESQYPLVVDYVHVSDHSSRPQISVVEKLQMTIRYLATGETQASLSYQFRLGRATIYKIIAEICRALGLALQPLYLAQPSHQQWKSIATDFYRRWQYPNCVGAIDGKRVRIRAPDNSGSVNYNYKGYFSTVLLAVCDAKYKLTMVNVGSPGHRSDSGVLNDSAFLAVLNAGTLGIPSEATALTLPHVFIADESFRMTDKIMRPFPGKDESEAHRVFNYRLSRARRTIENTFGITAARWRILHHAIHASPDHVDAIVLALCVLHNFLTEKNTWNGENRYCPRHFGDCVDTSGVLHEGDWRDVADEHSVGQSLNVRINRFADRANDLRSLFMHYFLREGAVPWQYDLLR